MFWIFISNLRHYFSLKINTIFTTHDSSLTEFSTTITSQTNCWKMNKWNKHLSRVYIFQTCMHSSDISNHCIDTALDSTETTPNGGYYGTIVSGHDGHKRSPTSPDLFLEYQVSLNILTSSMSSHTLELSGMVSLWAECIRWQILTFLVSHSCSVVSAPVGPGRGLLQLLHSVCGYWLNPLTQSHHRDWH